MKDALADCMHALKVQPWFTRAIERAAKCHLRLGDFAAAESLLSAAQARPQVTPEDARALTTRLAEVRQLRSDIESVWTAVATAENEDAAIAAVQNARALLDRVCDGFDVKLLYAAALLRAGRWRQAESAAMTAGRGADGDGAARCRLQAWWLQCETLYGEGELEKCVERLEGGVPDLEALERGAGGGSAALDRGMEGHSLGERVPLPTAALVKERAAEMRQVLQGRSAGNAAYAERRFEEAARLYTLALGERHVAAPAFWARLHSNRAAAYQVRPGCLSAMHLSTLVVRPRVRFARLAQRPAGVCAWHQ